ncbi:MAG: putative glycolipid-binding domain-containing protein [Pseudaminobacter sp.]|nr:putative glycolipid-binding domain-containing protein [Pseudaminobacter sp.]
MSEFAIWRRLDTPGHDAALLTQSDAGWLLQGTAVFKHQAGPACIHYSVDLDSSWRTKRGQVQGFLADRKLDHLINRESDGWYLNGALIDGLEHLWDLDYGFTPATNLQQLRRLAPVPGQVIDLPVAWFDIDVATLTELPQRYERRDETTYWYVAPSVPYEGLLELSLNGFARSYPQLWKMEI